MSDTTLEDELPRWILDEPTEADMAPGGGLEDCDGDGAELPGDGVAEPAREIEGLNGVDLPDPDAAEATYGNPPAEADLSGPDHRVDEFEVGDSERPIDAEENDDG